MIRDTSLLAYNDIKEQLNNRQEIVYEKIKQMGCPTNTEISKALNIPINAITPRVKELREKGLVEEYVKRECSVTGKTVWSWKIV